MMDSNQMENNSNIIFLNVFLISAQQTNLKI